MTVEGRRGGEARERTELVGGVRTHWREAPAHSPAPILYVHGVPTAGWDWLPFLDRIGGVAPDLPGFGSSEKPADFDYSIAGYDRWIESFVDARGLDRLSLVVHDWGGLGLVFAQRFPERIDRLVVFNCAPFLPGYRWHWIARVWRTPVVGELFMGTSSKWAFKQMSRQANVTPGPLPDEFIDRFWPDFDKATRRAILRLYRSAPPDELASAGDRLGELRCPALVIWGTRDPYIPAEFGRLYADALGGGAGLEEVEAGHWLWLDRPEVVDRAAEFLAAPRASAGAGVGEKS
jgi:pimeloyl-ACP methyl ester carboxylesterase